MVVIVKLFNGMTTIVLSSDYSQFYSGNVLKLSSFNEDNVMLLKSMTFVRYVSGHLPPVAETHATAFPLGGVWFLGFSDKCLKNHAFYLWPPD